MARDPNRLEPSPGPVEKGGEANNLLRRFLLFYGIVKRPPALLHSIRFESTAMARGQDQVRVLAGSLKGRVLRYPRGRSARPTMTRTKASLFDSLQGVIKGAVFVDLYAAAGGMGIEALSRGAGSIHFVEHDRAALGCLHSNLETCRIEPAVYRVHAEDVIAFLSSGALAAIDPHIVFADPPYEYADMPLLLEFLGAIDYPRPIHIILEHDRSVDVEANHKLTQTRVKNFGQTCVSFIVPAGGKDS